MKAKIDLFIATEYNGRLYGVFTTAKKAFEYAMQGEDYLITFCTGDEYDLPAPDRTGHYWRRINDHKEAIKLLDGGYILNIGGGHNIYIRRVEVWDEAVVRYFAKRTAKIPYGDPDE